MAGLTTGGFVFVWETVNPRNPSNVLLYSQRYAANGVAAGGPVQIASGLDLTYPPDVAPLAGGGYVVAWEATGEVKAQRFSAVSVPVGGVIDVNETTAGTQNQPSVALLSDGKFVVVWEGPDSSETGIFARVFNSDGTAKTGELAVNGTTQDGQFAPSVAGLDGDNFVVTWSTAPATGDFGVRLQTFTNAGAKVGGETPVDQAATGDQSTASVAAAAGGGYVITYFSNAPDFEGILARRFAADGSAIGTEFKVAFENMDDVVSYWPPAAAGLAGGGYAVVWAAKHSDNYDVFGQVYSSFDNSPPNGVQITNQTKTIVENTIVGPGTKVATLTIFDDGMGMNGLSLSGADAMKFESKATRSTSSRARCSITRRRRRSPSTSLRRIRPRERPAPAPTRSACST